MAAFWPDRPAALEEVDIITQCSIVFDAASRGELPEPTDSVYEDEVQCMARCHQDQTPKPELQDLEMLALRNWFMSDIYPERLWRPLTEKSFGHFPLIDVQGENIPTEFADLCRRRRGRAGLVWNATDNVFTRVQPHPQALDETTGVQAIVPLSSAPNEQENRDAASPDENSHGISDNRPLAIGDDGPISLEDHELVAVEGEEGVAQALTNDQPQVIDMTTDAALDDVCADHGRAI